MSLRRPPLARASGRSRANFDISAEGDEAEILLYDIVGWPFIEARRFVEDLKQITASTIHLRINSPGGSVFDGLAIYNALLNHKARIVTHIDGLAASIASVIALAGDEVRMAENALYMIHNPWTFTMGDAAQLRKDADILDKIGDQLVRTYVSAGGADEDEVRAWMDAETWFDADEALEAGFADAIDGASAESAASFDLSVFSKAPKELVAAGGMPASEPRELTKRDIERALRDAGMSRAAAKAFVARAGNSASELTTPCDAALEATRAELRGLITTLRP